MNHPGRPNFSLRDVPAGIYLGLGLSLVASFVQVIATSFGDGDSIELYLSGTARWRMLETGTFFAKTLLLSCGLLELARRHRGPGRALTRVAAGLLLANLLWIVAGAAITLIQPSDVRTFYDWFGRGIGMLSLAGIIMLTIGADAWRRVPLAAAAILLLQVTSYWIPGLGGWISRELGDHFALRHIYGFAREGLTSSALVFIAAALAAGPRDLAPDRRAAAGGLRLAYGSLMFRLVVALPIAMMAMAVATRSAGLVKLVVVGGPLVVVGTSIVFALGILGVAGSRIVGLPRIRLYVAAAILLTWTGIQLDVTSAVYASLQDGRSAARGREMATLFSVLGPLAAALAIALVGSAIASLASSGGDARLSTAATTRTGAFVVLSMLAVGIPALPESSLPNPLVLGMIVAVAGVIALAVFAGVLRRAADHVDAGPGLPPARVV
ncbi:MAG: hypothetical protein H6Q90_4014 [Deltaproteobacteria bacterium]|nr:hypothetical protein [Deltaproteobacteria bacterium]